jgi:hypothetical protein
MAQIFAPFVGLQPAAATNTTLFTSPAATQTMVAWLSACTTTKLPSPQDDSIRVYVIPSGNVAADQYLLICDMVVDATDPYLMNTPIILNTGDFIQVYSQNGNISFNGSGLELTGGTTVQTYAAFGGIKPAAATPTVLFTSPATKVAMGANFSACNTTKAGAGADDQIRVWVVPSGQSVIAPLDKYLIVCDMTVDQFDPYLMNTPIIMNAGDALVVYSTNGNIAFNGSAEERP